MTRRTRLIGGALVIVVVAAATAGLLFMTSGSRPDAGTEKQHAGGARGPVRLASEPAPPRAAMPPLGERIDALVNQYGVPQAARPALAALGADLAALRTQSIASVGDRDQRAARTAERRAVSQRTREVLETLPASYRAAMRRHKVSPRQLATWAADHPLPEARASTGS
jgi:hypothetical protein